MVNFIAPPHEKFLFAPLQQIATLLSWGFSCAARFEWNVVIIIIIFFRKEGNVHKLF